MHLLVCRLQVICHGKTYIQAVQKMQRALCKLCLMESPVLWDNAWPAHAQRQLLACHYT